MIAATPALKPRPTRVFKVLKKAVKRVVPLALAVYFIPWVLATYVCCGLLDVLRNRRRTWGVLDRYFAGNGVVTWLLSPFNLIMDVLCLPYRNRGIYQLADLPDAYRAEVDAIVAAAYDRDVVGQLEAKGDQSKRGMMFFKWYGRNVAASVDVPEYHQSYRYIRTIGISVFNKRQSTSEHFGPLRVTLRLLYNINRIDSPDVYIQVGPHKHYWRDEKLFIFDDTLLHQSVNGSDGVRYCLFVDILRPTPFPRLTSAILSVIRVAVARVNHTFYRQWTFIK